MRLSKTVAAAPLAVILLALGMLYFFFFRADDRQAVLSGATRSSARLPVAAGNLPPPVAESHKTTPDSARTILVENGMLTLTLKDQPLGSVLVEIAKKGRVNIYSAPAIDTHPVTVELSHVPLEQALQAFLRDYDVFTYKSGGFLQSAWVYEKAAGAQLVPVPPESWASTADVERQMQTGSPADRINAIETLVGRNGPNASEVVNRALLDENEDVRLRGLDVALSAGVNVSRETLTSLTYDSSAPVRILALEAIASGTAPGDAREAETEQLIRRLTGDSDADVRTKASEILDSRRPGN